MYGLYQGKKLLTAALNEEIKSKATKIDRHRVPQGRQTIKKGEFFKLFYFAKGILNVGESLRWLQHIVRVLQGDVRQSTAKIFQKHQSKPLLSAINVTGFFRVHYTTHATDGFTAHP